MTVIHLVPSEYSVFAFTGGVLIGFLIGFLVKMDSYERKLRVKDGFTKILEEHIQTLRKTIWKYVEKDKDVKVIRAHIRKNPKGSKQKFSRVKRHKRLK